MASDNSRRSSISNGDSGISCNSTVGTVNSRYACYWLSSCRGQHEIDDCKARHHELRGKLGIYYDSNGVFKRFSRDQINGRPLEDNPTGCTMINLLIYKHENNETWLAFVTKLLEQKRHDDDEREQSRQSLLALPSSYPRQKKEVAKQIAVRALESITDKNEILQGLQARLKRFLFVDASVIYPLYLPADQANLLTTHFTPNDEITSLHWFPLSTVLKQLPEWTNYLSKQAEERELAQVRHPIHAGIKLNKNNEAYTIWSVTATWLMCIRNHVGFETFLQP